MDIQYRFSRGVGDKLKHFVYALIDPRNDMPFYIGRGQRDRPFAHLKNTNARAGRKQRMLNAILHSGLKPTVVVVTYGLDKVEAERTEAVLITVLTNCGIDLVNDVGGAGCDQMCLPEDEINARLGAVPTTITEPCILVKLAKTFPRVKGSPTELMRITCGAWLLSNPRNPRSRAYSKKYILGEFEGVVRSAYTIDHSTWRKSKVRAKNGRRQTRWRCIGNPPPSSIKGLIGHADVSKYVGRKEFRFLPTSEMHRPT